MRGAPNARRRRTRRRIPLLGQSPPVSELCSFELHSFESRLFVDCVGLFDRYRVLMLSCRYAAVIQRITLRNSLNKIRWDLSLVNVFRRERNLDEALIFAQKCFIFGPKREESKMVIKEIAAVREKENEVSRSLAKSQSTNRQSLKFAWRAFSWRMLALRFLVLLNK